MRKQHVGFLAARRFSWPMSERDLGNERTADVCRGDGGKGDKCQRAAECVWVTRWQLELVGVEREQQQRRHCWSVLDFLPPKLVFHPKPSPYRTFHDLIHPCLYLLCLHLPLSSPPLSAEQQGGCTLSPPYASGSTLGCTAQSSLTATFNGFNYIHSVENKAPPGWLLAPSSGRSLLQWSHKSA